MSVFENRPAFPVGDWEYRWAAYDEPTYRAVLAQILPTDVVIEIGAGDLRLAYALSGIAQKVYALEINPQVLERGLACGRSSSRLVPICADARALPFPRDVTVGVLLMRHCTHFRLYAEKLKQAGAERLVTNARWRMDVECVALNAPRPAYEQIDLGWYACWCGKVGFKSGPAEKITPELDAIINDVCDCPDCGKN